MAPGIARALRLMVEERMTPFVTPTQRRSSMFITMLSWAMPRKTEASPVSFHQR